MFLILHVYMTNLCHKYTLIINSLIVRVKYYIYKYFLLHLNTFCAYDVMLKIGLKSAFLDRVVNKCSDCSMIEIRGISLILFCSRVFVLSLYW